jgi:hypothetical protein
VPVFVLVHSPVVGPGTWGPVRRELERRGRDAVVPSLLGIAGAEGPPWRHAADAVEAATADLRSSVVLVGHSSAGPLLPAIAGALSAQVGGLVFVDSFLPPATGHTALAPPDLVDRLRGLARGGVLPPWSSWFGEQALRALVPDAGLRAGLEQEMPRLPLACLEAAVPVPEGWDRRPCAYILFSRDPYGETAAEAHERGWPVTEIPRANHLSLVTDPVAVTDALVALV